MAMSVDDALSLARPERQFDLAVLGLSCQPFVDEHGAAGDCLAVCRWNQFGPLVGKCEDTTGLDAQQRRAFRQPPRDLRSLLGYEVASIAKESLADHRSPTASDIGELHGVSGTFEEGKRGGPSATLCVCTECRV